MKAAAKPNGGQEVMLDRIVALLEREIASVEHNLLTGACPDFTSYREQVATLATYDGERYRQTGVLRGRR